MLNEQFYQKLAEQYGVPVNGVQELANELKKSNGAELRFNIPALGGKGWWKSGQGASVGNGFNQEANHTIVRLCEELIEFFFGYDPEDEPTHINLQPLSSLDETIGPSSSTVGVSHWWPESYGHAPDIVGNAGSLRYAYFAVVERLVIQQNLSNRIFDTRGHTVEKLISGKSPGFFNLEVHTDNGVLLITQLQEVRE